MKINGVKVKWIILTFFFVVLINVDYCFGGKVPSKNKHNHNNSSNSSMPHDHHHHKNSSSHNNHHHENHHNSSHSNPHQNIGWSLHNNDQHHAKQPDNSHGFVMEGNQHGNHHQNQHHHDQHQHQNHQTPHAHPQQPSAPVAQDSGSSALASGVGGFALGAIGGAAGGYLLSNALNDDKKEEKVAEIETTKVAEVLNATETTIFAHSNETDHTNATVADVTIVATTIESEISTVESIEKQKLPIDENVVINSTILESSTTSKLEENKINVVTQESVMTTSTTAAPVTVNSSNFITYKSYLLIFSTLFLYVFKHHV